MINSLYKYLEILSIDTKNHQIDENLLITAFTHKSYAADAPEKKISFNERLEFLGDSILGAIVAAWLYKNNRESAESQLTLSKIYLVKESTLAKVARKINLGKYILLGNGEKKSGGANKDSVLSDGLEAFLGYMYINFGRKTVENFIEKYIIVELDVLSTSPGKSAKSELQEFIQKKRQQVPLYKNIELEIEDSGNVILYGADVYIKNRLIARGEGKSKKKAQEDGAQKALLKIKD